MKTLRQHQKEASDACIKEIIGYVNLPTGTGKTTIEIDVVRRLILENQKTTYGGVFVIVSPRIILSFQHLKNFHDELSSEKIDAYYMNVNSGHFSDKDLDRIKAGFGLQAYAIPSTTNFLEIKTQYDWCVANNKPLIISATYDSVSRVQMAGIPVDTYIFDEAHFMVDAGNYNEATKYVSKRKYFFTATPKTTDSNDGKGMNNSDLFGKCIYKRTPKQMIEAGEMVKPAIHLVSCHLIPTQDIDGAKKYKDDENKLEMSYDYKGIWRGIVSAHERHKLAIQEHSISPGKIGAKLLIILEGQRQLEGIYKTKEFKDYIASGKKVFALSSDFGIFFRNQLFGIKNQTRQDFLSDIMGLKLEDDCIILHVEMLTMGIDVPGITGIMPFRNMGKISFLQNLGRSTRLHTEDRTNLYNETLKPLDFKNYVKPYAWIVLPVFTANSTDYVERYKDIVRYMRSEYDFSPDELVIIHNRNSETVLEPFDEVNEHEREIRSISDGLHEYIHTLEDEEIMTVISDTFFKNNQLNDKEKNEVHEKLFKDHNLILEKV